MCINTTGFYNRYAAAAALDIRRKNSGATIAPDKQIPDYIRTSVESESITAETPELKKIQQKIKELKGDNIYKSISPMDLDSVLPDIKDRWNYGEYRYKPDNCEVVDICQGKPKPFGDKKCGFIRNYTYLMKVQKDGGGSDYRVMGYGDDSGWVGIKEEIKPTDIIITVKDKRSTVKEVGSSIPPVKSRWSYGTYVDPKNYRVLSVSRGKPKPLGNKKYGIINNHTYLMKVQEEGSSFPEYRIMGYGDDSGWVGIKEELKPDDIIITAKER